MAGRLGWEARLGGSAGRLFSLAYWVFFYSVLKNYFYLLFVGVHVPLFVSHPPMGGTSRATTPDPGTSYVWHLLAGSPGDASDDTSRCRPPPHTHTHRLEEKTGCKLSLPPDVTSIKV